MGGTGRALPAAGRGRHLPAGAADHAVRAAGRGMLCARLAALSSMAAGASALRAAGERLAAAPQHPVPGQVPGAVDDVGIDGNYRVAAARAAAGVGGVAGLRGGGQCLDGAVADATNGESEDLSLAGLSARVTSWMLPPSPPAPLPQAGKGSKPSPARALVLADTPCNRSPLPRAGEGWG
ncbi:hypothetical protein CBM2587_A20126 [Cupriavidus taiwanensis]|uniref:Uncharacterized protein n=1 Tax=Cupriavidus taiwanensis TaxID=164546 RepID=A0A976A0M5_9BURK|nr:hypothetical protein CBM2587_A20126 [Cupriavidus taiwanensis]